MKKNETIAGVLLSYISIGLSILSGLIYTPFLLRCLGQNEYGLYELMGGFILSLSALDFGLGVTVTRYVSRYNLLGETELQANFLAMCTLIYSIIAMLIVTLGTGLYLHLDSIFGNSLTALELYKAKKMYLLLIFSLVVTVFGNIFLGALSGLEKFIIPRVLQILKILLNMGLGILILYNGADSVVVTILNCALNIAVFGAVTLYALKIIKIRFIFWDKHLFKESSGFAFFVFLQGIMSQLYWRIGQLILGIMMDTAAIAIYAVAMIFNNMFLSFTSAIAGVLLPKASRLAISDVGGETITDFMIVTSRYILTVYGLLSIGFAAFGKEFLRIWAGEGYEQTYYIVLIVVNAALIPRVQASGNDIARAFNKHGFLTTMYFLMGVANVGTSIVLVKALGVIGAAIGTAIALIVGNTIGANIYFAKEFQINIRRCLKETFAGIGVVCLLTLFIGMALNMLLGYSGWMTFVLKVLFFALTYIILMLCFGFNKDEKLLLKSIINRFLVRRVEYG